MCPSEPSVKKTYFSFAIVNEPSSAKGTESLPSFLKRQCEVGWFLYISGMNKIQKVPSLLCSWQFLVPPHPSPPLGIFIIILTCSNFIFIFFIKNIISLQGCIWNIRLVYLSYPPPYLLHTLQNCCSKLFRLSLNHDSGYWYDQKFHKT